MPSPPTSSQPELEDLRPPGHWGRHPLSRGLVFAAIGTVVVGRYWVDGDGGTFLVCAGGLVLMPACVAGAIGQMQGNVSPLSGSQWRLISPIACVLWSVAFLLLSILLPIDISTSPGEPSTWFKAAAALAGSLVIIGLFIQMASLSDQWPDKWRPPYARQPPPEDPANAAPADDPTAGDDPERPT
jgi:hypothetical protein